MRATQRLAAFSYRPLLVATCLAAASVPLSAARADLPDVAWGALKQQTVLVTVSGGAKHLGKLIAFDKDVVILQAVGGSVTSVPRNTISAVSDVSPQVEPPQPQGPPAAGPTPGPMPAPPPAGPGGGDEPFLGPPMGGGAVTSPDAPKPSKPSKPQSDDLTEFLGFIARPSFCMGGCGGFYAGAGVEFGTRFISGALRYAYAQYRSTRFGFGGDIDFGFQTLSFDVRLSHDIVMHKKVRLAPFFETGLVYFATGNNVEIPLRFGARVSTILRKDLWLFFEPFVFELALSPNGVSGETVSTRYTLSAGVQYRF